MSAPTTKHGSLLDGEASGFNEHLEDGSCQGDTIAVVGCRDGEAPLVTYDRALMTSDLEEALLGATGRYCLVTPSRNGDGYEVEPTDRVEEIQRIKEPRQVFLILQDGAANQDLAAAFEEAIQISNALGVAVSARPS